jgi:hypothetical protein
MTTLLITAATLVALAAPAMAALTDNGAAASLRIMTEARTQCSASIMTDREYGMLVVAWSFAPEASREYAKAFVSAKIDRIGVETFCNEVVPQIKKWLEGPRS